MGGLRGGLREGRVGRLEREGGVAVDRRDDYSKRDGTGGWVSVVDGGGYDDPYLLWSSTLRTKCIRKASNLLFVKLISKPVVKPGVPKITHVANLRRYKRCQCFNLVVYTFFFSC